MIITRDADPDPVGSSDFWPDPNPDPVKISRDPDPEKFSSILMKIFFIILEIFEGKRKRKADKTCIAFTLCRHLCTQIPIFVVL